MSVQFTNGYWATPVAVTTAGEWFYAFKEAVVAAGGQVMRSGTGNSGSYNSSGDSLSSGSVANTQNAWCVIRWPDGTHYFSIQRIGTGTSFRCKYALADFTGGSPDENTVSSASGEQTWLGSGSDAVPSGSAWVNFTDTPYFLMGVDQEAPYGAWALLESSSGTNGFAQNGFAFLPIVGAHTGDADPYLIYRSGVAGGTSGPWSEAGTSGTVVVGFDGAGNWLTSWTLGGVDLIAASSGNDSVDSLFFASAPMYGVTGAETIKGFVDMVVEQSMPNSSGAIAERHSTFDHPDGGTNNIIRVGQFAAPWRGTIVTEFGSWTNRGILRVISDSLGIQPDEVAPEISNFVPTSGSTIEKTDDIQFDVTDETAVAAVAVLATFRPGSTEDCEVVYDSTGFRGRYRSSTITAISGGYRFNVVRSGGWPSRPYLEFLLVDTGGNIGVLA